jgi:hypothetical protein
MPEVGENARRYPGATAGAISQTAGSQVPPPGEQLLEHPGSLLAPGNRPWTLPSGPRAPPCRHGSLAEPPRNTPVATVLARPQKSPTFFAGGMPGEISGGSPRSKPSVLVRSCGRRFRRGGWGRRAPPANPSITRPPRTNYRRVLRNPHAPPGIASGPSCGEAGSGAIRSADDHHVVRTIASGPLGSGLPAGHCERSQGSSGFSQVLSCLVRQAGTVDP